MFAEPCFLWQARQPWWNAEGNSRIARLEARRDAALRALRDAASVRARRDTALRALRDTASVRVRRDAALRALRDAA